jgi:group II intron reverse transcriptase/maturase
MNAGGQSDGSVVPGKPPNKGRGEPRPAEGVEGRDPAEGNPSWQTSHRAQERERLQQALARVRQVAEKDKETKLTTLWHHVYDVGRLREAYFGLKRKSSPGVDGETWQTYGEDLEANLLDLSGRLKRGAYRAKPVRRVHIPKPDGRTRPIGVPTLEDKIVQRAAAEVMGAVYEADFLGFSYGFRPGRSQHDALDAVYVGITQRKVSWVLDADIRGFFDAIAHDWLVKFIEHRIMDKRVVRHVKKWLNAGVMDDGERIFPERGSPQGGSISPLLANIYLHYVLDLWAEQWRNRHARGDVIIVRYADDVVLGFQHEAEARRFLDELKERLLKFGLELNSDKTRLMEFGRFAAENRKRRGEGKPETFDFLGFTHLCGKTRKDGRFALQRRTMRKRLGARLKALRAELRGKMHESVPVVGAWLRAVLIGYFQYHAIPGNSRALRTFRQEAFRAWWWTLKRRSQTRRMPWRRYQQMAEQWLPRPRILHPYPNQRLRVRPKAGAV